MSSSLTAGDGGLAMKSVALLPRTISSRACQACCSGNEMQMSGMAGGACSKIPRRVSGGKKLEQKEHLSYLCHPLLQDEPQ